MWYMKLLWMVVTIASVYLLVVVTKWLIAISDITQDNVNRDKLKSIIVTFKPTNDKFLNVLEIADITDKINQKLKKPFGSLSDQIDVDDVVSVNIVPLPTKDVIQFAVWYKEKYKKPKAPPYGGYNMGRTGGNAYTKDTKPFWSAE